MTIGPILTTPSRLPDLFLQVQAEVEEARKGSLPKPELLYSDILTEGPPKYIRMPAGGSFV